VKHSHTVEVQTRGQATVAVTRECPAEPERRQPSVIACEPSSDESGYRAQLIGPLLQVERISSAVVAAFVLREKA
jgi:hypothetical protein